MLQIIRLSKISLFVSLVRLVAAEQLEFPELLSALNTLHPLTLELSLCCTLWCCHFVWHEEIKSRAWLEFEEMWMKRRRAKAQVAADREGSSQDPSFFQCIRCMVLWGQMKIVHQPQSSSVIRIHATCVADVGKFGKYVLLQTMNL